MRAQARRRPGLAVPDIPRACFDFQNGARLVVSPRAGAPVCAVQVHLRGGHSLDPSGREGTAYLTGALLDQGTVRHKDDEIAALLEPSGGSLTGNSTGLSGVIANEDWKLLVDLMSELATTPTFPAPRVQLQRGRLLSRLEVEQDNPRAQAGKLFRRLVYGDLWLGRPEYGNSESVESIRRGHLTSFHRRNWLPSRVVIAVCGDVAPEAVRGRFSRRLSGWRNAGAIGKLPWTQPAPGPRLDVFQADRQQVHVYLGHLGIRRSEPDYPALVVLDHILGSGPGFTSRVTRRLRDEQGLAYTVHASIAGSAGVMPGLFTAYIATSPENVETAIQGFIEEIRRIRDEPVTSEELQLARDYLLGSFALGFERASSRTQYLIFAERNDLAEDHLRELLACFAAVSVEDIQRVARKHLRPDECCVVAAGPIRRRDLEQIVRRATGKRRKVRS